MARKIAETTLTDGTVVRHKARGYQGKIDGTTALQNCFTNKGLTSNLAAITETFQYRVEVVGEKLRRIAPARDLEIVAVEQSTQIACWSCQAVFVSRPGVVNKAGGRCECSRWICPACLVCSAPKPPKGAKGAVCHRRRSRKVSRPANHKRKKAR